MGLDNQILDELVALWDETEEQFDDYRAVKDRRDASIRDAIDKGVSMYAIAKRLDVSQPAIAKIRDQP